MQYKLENKVLLIDFDSTFIKVETIDELAKSILDSDPSKLEKLNLINSLTNRAMSGEISFSQALDQRLKILKINTKDIDLVVRDLSNKISTSFKRNKDLIKSFSDKIWIISGGFTQIINPIVKQYGISSQRVIANTFLISNGKVIGVDSQNIMSKDKGKIKAINKLNIVGTSFMVGDGYTDYEVFLDKAVNHFIYYAENISRKQVMTKTNNIANTFEEVLLLASKLD